MVTLQNHLIHLPWFNKCFFCFQMSSDAFHIDSNDPAMFKFFHFEKKWSIHGQFIQKDHRREWVLLSALNGSAGTSILQFLVF